MLAHPIRKLLDLAQAARHVQDNASPDNINAFETLMTQMLDFELQSSEWDMVGEIPLIAHPPMVRGQVRTVNGLGIGGSLVFAMQDIDLTVSVYRENIVGSLKLQCDVDSTDWTHAAALLYQSDMLVDQTWVDREGEFNLTAIAVGEAHIKLRSVSGKQIVLSAIEIEP